MSAPAPRLRALLGLLAVSACALAVLLAGRSAFAGAAAPVGQSTHVWTQVFDDEFSGASLEQSRWYPNRWFAAR